MSERALRVEPQATRFSNINLPARHNPSNNTESLPHSTSVRQAYEDGLPTSAVRQQETMNVQQMWGRQLEARLEQSTQVYESGTSYRNIGIGVAIGGGVALAAGLAVCVFCPPAGLAAVGLTVAKVFWGSLVLSGGLYTLGFGYNKAGAQKQSAGNSGFADIIYMFGHMLHEMTNYSQEVANIHSGKQAQSGNRGEFFASVGAKYEVDKKLKTLQLELEKAETYNTAYVVGSIVRFPIDLILNWRKKPV